MKLKALRATHVAALQSHLEEQATLRTEFDAVLATSEALQTRHVEEIRKRQDDQAELQARLKAESDEVEKLQQLLAGALLFDFSSFFITFPWFTFFIHPFFSFFFFPLPFSLVSHLPQVHGHALPSWSSASNKGCQTPPPSLPRSCT